MSNAASTEKAPDGKRFEEFVVSVIDTDILIVDDRHRKTQQKKSNLPLLLCSFPLPSVLLMLFLKKMLQPLLFLVILLTLDKQQEIMFNILAAQFGD